MTDIKAQIAQSGMLKGSANSQHEIVASKVEVNTAGINLGDLTDVTITSPTDGSYVVYQSSSNTFLDDQTITKTATGINLTGNLDLPDDGKLLFGDDDDLQIYHDGTHSYIIDDGVGDLIIRGSDDIKLQTSAGERGIIINTDTSVELYYNNGLKLSTTAGGVDVIGTLEADAITVNGITLAETISDTVGAMVGSNTESGIAVTYDDLDNTLDFNVDDFNIALTGDVTGTGTVTNLGNVSFETTIPNSSIVNNQLANSSITVSDGTNSTATALGGTITFAAGSGLDVAESSGTITFAAEDAGFFNKGIASFSSSDFGISSGFVTIKSGGVTNTQLANNTVSYGGVTLALGATDGTPAFNLSDATNYPTSSLTGTITNAQLAGSIANNKLTNSSITVSDGTNTSPVALGGTLTFAGTTNEVAVTENAGTVTVGLPDDVTIAGDLSVSTAPTSGAHVTNKTYVDAQVANVVDSAPAALDTLNELAAALGDDANFATTTATSIGTKLPLAGGTMTGNITFNSTQAFDGRDVSADGSKLDLIEAAADVTDATNVTAAGALMDSEVTNLAQVKAFDETDYATAAQGAKADSALQTAPVTSVDGNTGAVTTLQLGTSSSTALAGDTALLQLGTSSTTALAGNTALLQLGTSSTTALAGDTALLQLGTSSSTALAGNTLAGDVGIGESSPARRLHVTAAAGVDYVARFQSDDVASGIELVDSVSTCAIRTSSGHLIMSADTGAGNDNTSIRFNLDHLTASANEGMRLDTTGLGIGTLTPSAKLDVNGNAKITGNLALVGSGYAANLTTNFGPDNTGSSSSWIRTGVELGVNAQEGQPNGIWVGNNGNNLYVTGSASDDVHEYDLSTPYKIATASLTNSAVFGNTYGNNVQSMWMNNGSSSFTITEDGTEVTYATGQYLLMVDGGSDQLRQFRLSTAWDMSTRSSSIIVTRDLSVADVNPTGVAFNSDGTKIIIVGSGGTGGDGDIIYSYNLSNPYDIRGIAVSSGSQAVAPDAKVLFSTFQETQGVTGTGVRDPITLVQDIAFTPDGKTVHIACKDRDGLVTFRLGTAFDITTMTYAGALDLSYIESNVSALYYDPVNNLALMSGQSNDTLYEFTTNNNALVTDAKSTRFQGKITVDDDSLIEGNLLVAGKLLVRASVIGVGVTMTGNIAFTGNGGITTKIGGTTATGDIDIGRSSKSQTMNLSSFSDTESGQAKVVNIATKGLSSSARTVNIASDSITGVTTTVNIGNPNTGAVGTILMSGSLEVNPGSVGRTTIIGGTEQTGAMTFGRSTASQTINIGTGITASGATKTINIGTAGASSSTTKRHRTGLFCSTNYSCTTY